MDVLHTQALRIYRVLRSHISRLDEHDQNRFHCQNLKSLSLEHLALWTPSTLTSVIPCLPNQTSLSPLASPGPLLRVAWHPASRPKPPKQPAQAASRAKGSTKAASRGRAKGATNRRLASTPRPPSRQTRIETHDNGLAGFDPNADEEEDDDIEVIGATRGTGSPHQQQPQDMTAPPGPTSAGWHWVYSGQTPPDSSNQHPRHPRIARVMPYLLSNNFTGIAKLP